MILAAFLVFYRLLWVLLTPLVMIYLWHRGRRDPDYTSHLLERFGRYPRLPQHPIWIHAVSLGELRSAVPLARDLLNSGETIVFTHFTPAGRREAHNVFADDIAAGRVASVWVPLDIHWIFRRFFRACHPKMGLTMEIEIWPAMVMASRASSVPLYMCNAQYPSKSIKRDSTKLRIRQRIMGKFAGAFVKSQLQADRFSKVGVSNIHITGELRFDQPVPPALLDAAATVAPNLAGRPILTIASAIEGEDPIFIDAIKALHQQSQKPLVIYVPRAPERFSEVGSMLTDAGFKIAKRSDLFGDDLSLNTDWPSDIDILLGDSMGEMYFYLSLADRVIVGGGFHPNGAHNVIEPLALAKPVVTGPHTFTIEYPFTEAEAAGVACSVPNAEELAALLMGPDWTTTTDIAGFMQAHSGASKRTVATIKSELSHQADI